MNKKLLFLPIAGCIALSLASCGSGAKVNSQASYGNLSDTKSYATLGDKSISQKKLYDLMRADGYSTVTDSIKKDLFSDVLTNTEYFDYANNLEDHYYINNNLVGSIYGVNDAESFNNLKIDFATKTFSKEVNTKIQKYVDGLFAAGTKKADGTFFTVDDIKSIEITTGYHEYGNDAFTAQFPKELYESSIYGKAMEKYALSQIKNPNSKYYFKNEYIKGEGKNPYYINTDIADKKNDVKKFYNDVYKSFRDYKGIVIKFTSQAQAERIIKSAIGDTQITDANALESYLSIYNLRYVTRDDLTVSNYQDNYYTNLSETPKNKRFTSLPVQVQSYIKNDDVTAGTYLAEPFNFDGSYYMVYVIEKQDIVEWDELTDNDKNPEVADNIYNKTLEKAIENKAISTLVSKLENDRYDEIIEKNIEIYDPVYAVKFKSSYDDYDLTSVANNDLVYKFTYENVTYDLSVEKLYEKLEPKLGTAKAINYLSNQYYLSLENISKKIDNDGFDDYKSELNKEIKKFNQGKKDYSKKIGVANYLQLAYGVSTKEEVLDNYKASLIKTLAMAYNGNHAKADDAESFNTEDKVFTNLASIYKKQYDNYFSASISHILIGVDEEGTGNYTDPSVYRDNLSSEALKTKFDATILRLANTIIDEVNTLKNYKNIKDVLAYIVNAYNNNLKVGSASYNQGTAVYWDEYKNEFPISLKAEDLNEISTSNAGSYMSEFDDAAKKLYKAVKDGTIKESDVEDKGVFEYSTNFASVEDFYDKCCKTVYGYHMLNVYKIGELSSASYSKDDDKDDSDRTDPQYKVYEHREIIVEADIDYNGDKDDDPELVLYADAYNDKSVYASTSQLFIYYYETTNGGSVKSLPSSVTSNISKLFGEMVNMYNNSNFKEWRMLKNQISITFTDDASKMDTYIAKLERELFSYTYSEYTLFQDWITSAYDWSIELN